MSGDAHEVNFDGLIGPTYNHAVLTPGNFSSLANRGRPGNPKTAALEGLAKAETIAGLGVPQALLPPHVRPNLRALHRLGLVNDPGLLTADDMPALAACLAKAAVIAPDLVAACFASSSCWCANAATVSPSSDTDDEKVHFTPANMTTVLARSFEAEENAGILKQVFNNDSFFSHHAPLPATSALGDEGDANHMRFSVSHGAPGMNVFIYGREGQTDCDSEHRSSPRQTKLAAESVSRLHGLDAARVLFVKQNATAIAAGAFHCDVIAGAHRDILFCHEHAFADQSRAICEMADLFHEIAGNELKVLEVRDADVTLDDALGSYLFNSQIVTDGNGKVTLVSPRECWLVPRVRRFLERLFRDGAGPFDRLELVNTRGSMRSGGGPACLRLRTVLKDKERNAVAAGVFLTEELAGELRQLISADYPEQVTAAMFSDAAFLRSCFAVTSRLYRLLGLLPVGT